MGRTRRYNTHYSPEFKISVILDMRENGLSYSEAVRKHWQTETRAETEPFRSTVRRWERKYLEEGEEGFMKERRGLNEAEALRRNAPPEEGADLLAENRRLRERNEYLEAELAYLKKLDALVRAEEERSGRGPRRCPN